MSRQTFLIDTNVIIHLEDNKAVEPAFALLLTLCAKHKLDIFVHEAARDDIARDKDIARRRISLSKLEKFQSLAKVRGLHRDELETKFGIISRPNDIVDATLLHALLIGAADFLVTEDRGLHERARRHSAELGRRILFVPDAVQYLRTTFEPIEAPIRYIREVSAHSIPISDPIFDSLRADYAPFDDWWQKKCVKTRRECWIIEDDGLAGLLVRKDETGSDTDATNKLAKILKICTLKIRPDKRGLKLGELLLKKAFWHSQRNNYDLIYLTTYEKQTYLIDLLEYFGFMFTANNTNGERIYEKTLSRQPLLEVSGANQFDTHRINYPRFVVSENTKAFGIPIKEPYHDILFPDLRQTNLFDFFGDGGPRRPGNTIRKVYLCRAPSNLDGPGSILFFYKGSSNLPPSQSITAIGILEDLQLATSTKELLQKTGGRSVYSEGDIEAWGATPSTPVKVITFLLAAYIDPPISIKQLKTLSVVTRHPPQSIYRINYENTKKLISQINLGFQPY